jgi:hypothetical protein
MGFFHILLEKEMQNSPPPPPPQASVLMLEAKHVNFRKTFAFFFTWLSKEVEVIISSFNSNL